MKITKKGFTLSELLIVVAIVAVLVAIAIPIFAAQLERSRESTDAANIRAQYAEVMLKANDTSQDVNTDGSYKVELKQGKDNWQNKSLPTSLGTIAALDGTPTPGGSAYVDFRQEGKIVTIHFTGGTGGETPDDPETSPSPSPSASPSPTAAPTTTTHEAAGSAMSSAMQGAGSNSKATVTVNKDGSFTVEVTKDNDGTYTSKITNALTGMTLTDEAYPNGYTITINMKGKGEPGEPKYKALH